MLWTRRAVISSVLLQSGSAGGRFFIGRASPGPYAGACRAGTLMPTIVDIADLAVSREADEALITFSLGSCIGVTLWDPAVRVGGLLHFMLPNAHLCPAKAESHPAMFCDTGIPALVRAACELGAEHDRLIVKAAGGGQLLDDGDTFNIGQRNYLALRTTLEKIGVPICAEDVGGPAGRTLRLDVGNGVVTVKSRQQEVRL